MSRFYVASSLTNALNVGMVMRALTNYGHVLTYDWTKHGDVRSDLKWLPAVARNEMDGIRSADFVVVLLVPDQKGRGTHCELGAAIGLCKRVYIVCEDGLTPDGLFRGADATCVFYHHPHVTQLDTRLSHAIEYILEKEGVGPRPSP